MKQVSLDMLQHNLGLEVQIKLQWKNILTRIREGVQGRESICFERDSTYFQKKFKIVVLRAIVEMNAVSLELRSQYERIYKPCNCPLKPSIQIKPAIAMARPVRTACRRPYLGRTE